MDKVYSFDQIRVNSRQDQQTLKEYLPVEELKSECKEFYFRRPSLNAKKAGYNAAINFIAPTNNFFKILHIYESILDYYKVSKIEIAEDTIYPTKCEAWSAFMESQSMNKRWSTYYHLYIPSEKEFKNKRKGNGLWSDRTAYYGRNDFKLAVYARTSKINAMPCLRKEFRLIKASNIKKRTGIEFIRHFIDYNIEYLFEQLVDKYIKYDEIDIIKVGKWLLNLTRRRNLTLSETRRAALTGRIFCGVKGFSGFADFKYYLREKKAEIKNKKGRKSAFDKKMLKARYNYFRQDIEQ